MIFKLSTSVDIIERKLLQIESRKTIRMKKRKKVKTNAPANPVNPDNKNSSLELLAIL